ncbi:citryl-CoA lyase [Agrobacterium vitis]|uniref:citryl-CoA lyase n=1 Tax=Rhizobium/Agrobacterium group TaxID=227290 RepID=UPI0009BF6FCB|nr:MULTISPECIES: citryl-CoA lyase [Rhizobium/Agrobacterium group]MCF1436911.1 citryl-CoA lyase [Allorhizobium ampelinum]MUO92440.1 citryl-CoA lyase [Agrobacterium vitis]MUZ55614.1 citryl-CoA lyase [Agrobacterium vitis]MUZ94838.1 citryl-CoA lyase [Agrobacterium vitis]MVA43236.1 citryl-CoA lyase [Agrobacterium vitis]
MMKSAEELPHAVWRTAITDFGDGRINIRGVPIEELMRWGSFGDVVFLLFAGRKPNAGEGRLFNAILIAASDHGPTSPSTLAGRVIASGNRRAPEAAVAGGLLAIGDAHGGAGEASMVMLSEALRAADNVGNLDAAALSIVKQAKEQKRRLPGLGHRFHGADPRANALFSQAEAQSVSAGPIAMIKAIERALETESGRHLPINVDGAIAAVLLGMGFEPLIARLIFIIGRCAGVATHVREELEREKPMRIRFPYIYDGPLPMEMDRQIEAAE